MKTYFFISIALFATASLGSVKDVIDPVGEEYLGHLLIQEPKWGSAEEKNTFSYSLTYRGIAVRAGFKKRFTAGTGCIELRSTELSKPIRQCDVRIEKKKTTEFKLSGTVVRWPKGRDPLKVDFGPPADLRVLTETGSLISKQGGSAWSGTATRGLVLLPGKYTFGFSIKQLESNTVVFEQGQAKHVTLKPEDKRAKIIVQLPKKAFPNPQVKSCQNNNKRFLLWRNKRVSLTYWEPHPYDIKYNRIYKSPNLSKYKVLSNAGESTLEIKVFPFPETDRNNHYQFVVNNLVDGIDLEAGKQYEVELKRIDVNDVLVTKEDGQKEYVRGTFRIFRRNEATQSWDLVAGNGARYSDCSGSYQRGTSEFQTKSGIDVLPGTYQVEVNYQTAEGAKRVKYDIEL